MNYTKNNRMLAVFKSLSNTNRLKILRLIYFSPKRLLNVGEIYEKMEIAQPTISDHLKLLRLNKIIRAKQHGSYMFYSIADPLALELIGRMDNDTKLFRLKIRK